MAKLKQIKTPYHVRARKRANRWRDFPTNTCPASRHAQMIGDFLASKKRYPMLEEEPEHCAGSILTTVASLYQCRTIITRLRAQLAKRK